MAAQTAINSVGALPARFGFFSFEGTNSEPGGKSRRVGNPGIACYHGGNDGAVHQQRVLMRQPGLSRPSTSS